MSDDPNVVVKSSRFAAKKETDSVSVKEGNPLTITDTSEINESAVSKRIDEDNAAMLGPWGTARLKYPNNTEGYAASITFTLMQVKTFAEMGKEEGNSFSAITTAAAAAKTASVKSRAAGAKAKKADRELKRISKKPESDSSFSSPWASGSEMKREALQLYKEGYEEARQEQEKYKQEAIQHSAQAKEAALKAIGNAVENAERDVGKREGVPAIRLYLPIGFQQSDSFNIAGTELGILGAGVFAGTSQTGSLISSFVNSAADGFSSILDLAAGDIGGLQAATVVSRLANKFTPTEVSNAFNIAAGVTVNPNLRSTFKGVNLREYTFQFKFLPKSSKEAETVEQIIKLFREYSYPEVIELGGVAAGYKFPDLFEIKIQVETAGIKKRVGNKIKNCYLRSVSTNYNPTSMSFHTDGNPVEIDLSLNFIEETTVSRKDVRDGY